jgi:hypothetical protein
MPEFNFADAVTCLLSRVNFVEQSHLTEMQKLRRSAQAKA